MEQLLKIKQEYVKLYPKLKWELKHEEKTNYSPGSDVIYFEGEKFYPKRFIKVEDYRGYREDIVSKLGQYKLQIYLHPILKIYGEDTADENPTISKYFKHYPTESEIKQELQKKKSSWFSKMKEGGSIKTKGTFKPLGAAKKLGIKPNITGHDMIAVCDCGEKFSYKNSNKHMLIQCPECNGMKKLYATKMADGGVIKYMKGKKYMSGDGWVAYSDKDGGNVSIKVDSYSGWDIDPHRYLGSKDIFRLNSNGRVKAEVSLPKGGFSIYEFAKKLHSIAQEQQGKNIFSISEYENILKLYFDMQQDFQLSNDNY